MERTWMEARGGRRGGGGTRTGEQVIVTWDGAVLEVFHETGAARFHAAQLDKVALEPSPAPTGESLQISAARFGAMIPVKFEGEGRAALERILAAVRAAG